MDSKRWQADGKCYGKRNGKTMAMRWQTHGTNSISNTISISSSSYGCVHLHIGTYVTRARATS